MARETAEFRTSCAELETIAALFDRRSSRDERARLLEHLDGCEACWELFTESARFLLDDEEAAAEPRRPVRLPTWMVAAATLAAALALLLLTPLGRSLAPGADDGASGLARLLADSPRAVAALEADRGWAYLRGGSAPEPPARRAFRLGVLQVDLDVALGAGERARARLLLAEMRHLLAPESGSSAAAAYGRLAEVVAAEGEPTEVAATREEAARALDGELAAERSHLALGAWAEAGRLVAATGDVEPLVTSPARRLARAVDAARLAPELRGPFEELSARLESLRPSAGRRLLASVGLGGGRPGSDVAGALERDFAALVARGGNL